MTATPPPSHPAPELVERVARAIENDLTRQAEVQHAAYMPEDECGVASACMNIVLAEGARAAISAIPDTALAERLWEALKQRCCADPTTAKRIVTVSRQDFDAAFADAIEAGAHDRSVRRAGQRVKAPTPQHHPTFVLLNIHPHRPQLLGFRRQSRRDQVFAPRMNLLQANGVLY